MMLCVHFAPYPESNTPHKLICFGFDLKNKLVYENKIRIMFGNSK